MLMVSVTVSPNMEVMVTEAGKVKGPPAGQYWCCSVLHMVLHMVLRQLWGCHLLCMHVPAAVWVQRRV